jgi:hypothetical protein
MGAGEIEVEFLGRRPFLLFLAQNGPLRGARIDCRRSAGEVALLVPRARAAGNLITAAWIQELLERHRLSAVRARAAENPPVMRRQP